LIGSDYADEGTGHLGDRFSFYPSLQALVKEVVDRIAATSLENLADVLEGFEWQFDKVRGCMPFQGARNVGDGGRR